MIRIVGLGLLGVLAVCSLVWGASHALFESKDLMLRRMESDLYLRGQNPYILPEMIYLPPSLGFYGPIVARFDADSLRVGWLVLNGLALGLVIFIMIKLWGGDWPWTLQAALALIVVASKPVRGGIALGQFHLWPLVGLLAAFWLIQRRRWLSAGIITGMALIKVTMIAPFLGLLVIRKQVKSIFIICLIQGLALAIVCWQLQSGPLALFRDWSVVAKRQHHQGTLDLPSLLLRNWPDCPLHGGTIAVGLLGLVMLGLVWKRRADDSELFNFCCLTACVFAYHRHYDQTLLLPTLALAMGRAWQTPSWLTIGWAGLFASSLMAPSSALFLGRWEHWHEVGFTIMVYGCLVQQWFLLSASQRRIIKQECSLSSTP